jgi:AMP phosphorylase
MNHSGENLRVRILDIEAGKPIVLMHEYDAQRMSIYVGDRIRLCKKAVPTCSETGIVDITDTMVKKGEIGIFNDISMTLGLKSKEAVTVVPGAKPASIAYIRKKIDGLELNPKEIKSVVEDIVDDNLSDIELTSFVTASSIYGYTRRETIALTWAMVNTGDRLEFEGTVVDKHCIGGVPGNRTTLMIVPMLASMGLKIPKTSSRAITSASGTADTMEVLAPVSYDSKHIKRFVNRIGGCIVWGGALNLAPADDKIIRVEYPLAIDAEGQVLASIISKKKSVDSNYVLIDIPFGDGAKMSKKKEAEQLGRKFVDLGEEVDMKVKYLLTDGTHPIGNGVGPILEARDVLMALDGNGPEDLVNKSVTIVAQIIEFCGASSKGEGEKEARECLKDGSALKKMRDIIRMQGGDPNIQPGDLKPGRFKESFLAKSSGRVSAIHNVPISRIARAAGSPKDTAAGILLNKRVGDRVAVGETLFTVYSQNKIKLDYAIDLVKRANPFSIK